MSSEEPGRPARSVDHEVPMGEADATLVFSEAERAMLVATTRANGNGPPELPSHAPVVPARTAPLAAPRPPSRNAGRLLPGPDGLREVPAALPHATPPAGHLAPGRSGEWMPVLLAAVVAAAVGGFAAAELARAIRGDSSHDLPRAEDASR